MGISVFSYLFLTLINSFILLWNIFYINGRAYSIKMFVNLFIFVFFILANAIQFGNKSNVLTFMISLTEEDYVFFQFQLFLIILLFNYFYTIIPSWQPIQKKKKDIVKTQRLIILAIVCTIIVLVKNNFDPLQLFTRGLSQELLKAKGIQVQFSGPPTSWLLFEYLVRPIAWACFMIATILNLKKKVKWFLFLCTLITECPTAMARNAAAMLWIPIIVVTGYKYIRGYRFLILMFIGIFIIFPLLDNFRWFDGSFRFNLGLNYLDSMNFDASQVQMAVIKEGIITYGNQLLGVILFFIPRSLWPTKPIGSGHFFVIENNGWFTNISMPFFSEGYLNFGFIGVFLFVYILAYIAKKFDSHYWSTVHLSLLNHGEYYIVLGASMFFMRGDLMSSFAYTLGFIGCYKLVCFFTVKRLLLK